MLQTVHLGLSINIPVSLKGLSIYLNKFSADSTANLVAMNFLYYDSFTESQQVLNVMYSEEWLIEFFLSSKHFLLSSSFSMKSLF